MDYLYFMKLILASYFFSYYFVNVALFHNVLRKLFSIILKKEIQGRLKPFDCVTCLSVWTAGIFYFMPHDFIDFVFIIFSTGILSTIDYPTHFNAIIYKIGKI